MTDWKGLARQALRGALEVRRSGQVPKEHPVCVYDLAERLGVEVRFFGGNTFGGMYAKSSDVILVPSLRPPGRQAFTAAHELGHWRFGHGSRIDEVPEFVPDSRDDPEEWTANLFAAYLLMPIWAVDNAFARRGFDPSASGPAEIYTIASELGVGYETLIKHLRFSLQKLTRERAEELLKATPKAIRLSLIGKAETKHLLIVDRHWLNGNVDLQVGHMALLPRGTVIEGGHVAAVADLASGRLVRGLRPGVSRAFVEGCDWAKFLRVSRADFVGRAIYRHMEDPDAS
jgi:Zn-dependent peptidase ImmA (M78 family)